MSITPPSGTVNGPNPKTEHTAQYPTQYLVGGVSSLDTISQIYHENRAYTQLVGTNMTPNRRPPVEFVDIACNPSPQRINLSIIA